MNTDSTNKSPSTFDRKSFLAGFSGTMAVAIVLGIGTICCCLFIISLYIYAGVSDTRSSTPINNAR